MRKNSPRKWLHAILDLVPVILIPVFMIYSHRHVLTESTDVQIEYKYESNEVNTLNDLQNGKIYHCDDLFITDDVGSVNFSLYILSGNLIELGLSVEDNVLTTYNSNEDVPILMDCYGTGWNIYFFNDDSDESYIYFDVELSASIYDIDFYIKNGVNDFITYYQWCIDDEDITTMPTYSNFNVIESVNIDDTNSTITDAFLNNFNGTIQKYFNFGNVFNFGNIWNWFNTNIFGGNAPSIVYSVWCIVLYEFIMDLIFLIYALFMFFVDFCTNLIDRFHVKCSGGK